MRQQRPRVPALHLKSTSRKPRGGCRALSLHGPLCWWLGWQGSSVPCSTGQRTEPSSGAAAGGRGLAALQTDRLTAVSCHRGPSNGVLIQCVAVTVEPRDSWVRPRLCDRRNKPRQTCNPLISLRLWSLTPTSPAWAAVSPVGLWGRGGQRGATAGVGCTLSA